MLAIVTSPNTMRNAAIERGSSARRNMRRHTSRWKMKMVAISAKHSSINHPTVGARARASRLGTGSLDLAAATGGPSRLASVASSMRVQVPDLAGAGRGGPLVRAGVATLAVDLADVLAVGVGGGSRRRSQVFFFDLIHGL
jgi:hypothetical protein